MKRAHVQIVCWCVCGAFHFVLIDEYTLVLCVGMFVCWCVGVGVGVYGCVWGVWVCIWVCGSV